jgi:hypothetical protein
MRVIALIEDPAVIERILRSAVFAIRPLVAGLAAAARIDQGEKHRSPTRNTPTAGISRHRREEISYPLPRR